MLGLELLSIKANQIMRDYINNDFILLKAGECTDYNPEAMKSYVYLK